MSLNEDGGWEVTHERLCRACARDTASTTSKTPTLANEPDRATSTSASREPEAKPSPRLQILTAIQFRQFGKWRRSTSHWDSPSEAPATTPIVPKLAARAAIPSIRKLGWPPIAARAICS